MTGGMSKDHNITDATEFFSQESMKWSQGPTLGMPLAKHCLVQHSKQTFFAFGGVTKTTKIRHKKVSLIK